jgi:hypothetical protein
MPVDAEKEITRLWRALHGAQDTAIKNFYQWRKVAVELAKNGNAMEIGLKGWEAMGQDLGKSFLPRLGFKKGENGFVQNVAGLIAGAWQGYGALAGAREGAAPSEAIITWTRCPWPSFAKDFEVPMKEDVAGCDLALNIIVDMANAFMGTSLKIETLKAIPRGEGMCVRRLYKP